MKNSARIGGIAATTAILMTGSTAFADVTSQQVWDDWKSYMSGFGYDMQSSETVTSGGVTVSDINMAITLPEEGGKINIAFGEIAFADNGDGTVSISIPPVMPVVVSGGGPDGSGSATLNYTTTGFTMNVSGDPTAMTYTYSAAAVGLALAQIVADGTPVDVGTASIEMTKVSGSSDMKIGNLRSTTQRILSGPVTYAMDFRDPEDGGRMILNGAVNSLTMQATADMPADLDMTDMVAALAAGFAVDGQYEFGPGNMTFNFQDDGESVQGKSQSDGGNLHVAMDETRISYGGRSSSLQMEFAGGDIPFPVALGMGEAMFDLLMPLQAGEQPQDFGLEVLLGDFTMSDFIWGIFDPSAQLPRDPATIALDVSGLTTLFANLMDPEAMAQADVPGELNAVTLKNLTVSAAGAELTGSGDFVIDNTDTATFEGMPKPVGVLNVGLKGGNGLLDKLVAMGLLPEEQAMGARMAMGMFTVPGDGADSLKSQIEVTEQGHVLANGQRLK